MGFEAMFPQRRLRHEAGESGNAQEWTAIDGIDLENNTFSVRRLASASEEHDGHGGQDGTGAPRG